MSAKIAVAALVLALASLIVSITGRDATPEIPDSGGDNHLTTLGSAKTSTDYEARLQAIEARLRSAGESGNDQGGNTEQARSIDERLAELESAVAKLASAYQGISLEASSEERDALFRGEDGYLKADEYFAAEKFAIAGEGYLAFLEAHPDPSQAKCDGPCALPLKRLEPFQHRSYSHTRNFMDVLFTKFEIHGHFLQATTLTGRTCNFVHETLSPFHNRL